MRSTSSMILAAASLIVILSATSCDPAYSSGASHTYLGFSIGISNAPPPPRLAFYGRPRQQRVEYTEVQVIEAPDPSCDLFSYQGAFYLYSGGYWYRGDRYDGPYRVVEVRRVPHAVLTVPAQHWHHPPGHDGNDHGEHGHHGHGDHD